jgi:signal transduction histidine kinase
MISSRKARSKQSNDFMDARRSKLMHRIASKVEDSKLALLAAGLIVVILLGFIDYLTGPEISISVLFVLPISLVAWYAGRPSGMIMAVASAITWLVADLTTQPGYTHPLIPYWNALVRLLFFLIIVFLESALKNLNQDLESRVRERTTLLEMEVAERKKVEERLQQYSRRLGILYEIDQAILSAHSLEAVAATTILHVKHLLACDRVSFLLFDFEAQRVALFDTLPAGAEQDVSIRRLDFAALGDLKQVLEAFQGQTVHLNNDLLATPLAPPLARLLVTQDYRSLALAPILVQDELIGSLNLFAFNPKAFHPMHLEIGHEVASQLGIVINQATLVNRLRADQEKLQALSQQLLGIQETERRKIARELHDEVGQALTAIGLTLEMATRFPAEALADQLTQAHALIVELTARVSQISLELRPALLDDLGLLPALLWHLDLYATRTGVNVSFKHSGLEGRRFAAEIETAAYRIVQEALTNIARHAQVSEAKVTVWVDQDILGIQVEDEGSGFDPGAARSGYNSGGLFGMQERAFLLNGKLIIESSQGKGARLLAEIPIHGQAAQESDGA